MLIEQIKTYRRQLKLSQAQFAARFGLPLQTFVQWERRRREPEQSAKMVLELILDNPEAVQKIARRWQRHAWAQEAQHG